MRAVRHALGDRAIDVRNDEFGQMIEEEDVRLDDRGALIGGCHAELDLIHARFEIQPLQLVRGEDHRLLQHGRRWSLHFGG